LILDEATSSLDSVTEAAIQDALDRVMEGKTVIVVAHRLSTIAHLDRILVFDRGRVVEDGSHAELLARRGAYFRLWSRQYEGFLPAGAHSPAPDAAPADLIGANASAVRNVLADDDHPTGGKRQLDEADAGAIVTI
jgi:ATP-binding cassette subfamily B protein